MMNNTRILRVVTNLCLATIIGMVALCSFGLHALAAREPALRGRTGADNIALQIAVERAEDVGPYMDILEEVGAYGTFFFCSSCFADSGVIQEVMQRGHGVGSYTCPSHESQQAGMYIGGGYSVTVMSYESGEGLKKVCPSINMTKLIEMDNWQDVLRRQIRGDMFIYIMTDRDREDFEKVVQIVLDKGYTIMKVNEML